jgi:hypothetical protein
MLQKVIWKTELSTTERAALTVVIQQFSCERADLSVVIQQFSCQRAALLVVIQQFSSERAALSVVIQQFSCERAALTVVIQQFSCERADLSVVIEQCSCQRAALSAVIQQFSCQRAALSVVIQQCSCGCYTSAWYRFVMQILWADSVFAWRGLRENAKNMPLPQQELDICRVQEENVTALEPPWSIRLRFRLCSSLMKRAVRTS